MEHSLVYKVRTTTCPAPCYGERKDNRIMNTSECVEAINKVLEKLDMPYRLESGYYLRFDHEQAKTFLKMAVRHLGIEEETRELF